MFFFFCAPLAWSAQKDGHVLRGIHAGMEQADFLKIYPLNDLRGLRHDGVEDWLTYNVPLNDPLHEVVTFYFQNEKLAHWAFNDRPELVKEYLGEFCFYQDPSLILSGCQGCIITDAVSGFFERHQPSEAYAIYGIL